MKRFWNWIKSWFKKEPVPEWVCVGECHGKPLYRHNVEGNYLSWDPEGHWEISEVTHTSETEFPWTGVIVERDNACIRIGSASPGIASW